MIDKLLTRINGPLRIHSLYLISGVYDLTDLQYTTVNENNILSINSSNVNELSPLNFDFTEWPKEQFSINIYVGQYESPTFIKQSMELFSRFVTDGFKVRMQFVLGHDHFTIVEDLSMKSYDITNDIVSEK